MDAAFMSYQQHDGGIHALWLGAGEAGVTEVRFRFVPWAMADRKFVMDGAVVTDASATTILAGSHYQPCPQ
jgi:hypothetical protein